MKYIGTGILMVTGILITMSLAACGLFDIPENKLVCSVGAEEVFESAPSEIIYRNDRADSWVIEGQGTYTPPNNSMCSLERVN